MTKRVCIIGGGPAGIMTAAAIKNTASVQVYERANDIGGQWANNTDETTQKLYGSRHSSMYAGLQTNAPLQGNLEVPNFPFKEATPSYVSADIILKYYNDYIDEFALKPLIKTLHNVEKVEFDEEKDNFAVTITDWKTKETSTEIFDYVVVASGHFSAPHNPSLPGEETFSGSIMHSHDFLDGKDFEGKKVLCIGGSYSGEDICMSCWKGGATLSHVSTRKPAGLGYVDWPENVAEKPAIENISQSTVTFKDGSSCEYDVIIKCTGYEHKFSFLPEKYEDMGGNCFVPKGLYKQCIAIDNPKLWFMGMQILLYSNNMFQLQAYLLRETLVGNFVIPDKDGRQAAFEEDKNNESKIASVQDVINFQTNYVNELATLTNEVKVDASEMFASWIADKVKSIVNFRNNSYASIHTGKVFAKIG